MKTILFQGDSITDCGRKREDLNSAGTGYALFAKSELCLEYGNEAQVYNKGISGNRIVDVYARIKKDIINLKPDYMSILIGVNDVWHEIEAQNGVDAGEFEFMYDRLITKVKQALPDIKIAIMEPYVLRHISTDNTEEKPDRWDRFKKEVSLRAEAAKRIADKHGLYFIPLQQKLEDAAKRLGIDVITGDGVHPKPAGHRLIANEWLKCFKENFEM